MAQVKAPMVGMVIEVLVEAGVTVSEEDELLIIESMKMQIPVTAPEAGTITAIHVTAGTSVQEDDLLLEYE